MVLGENVRPASPTSTAIDFAAAILARPKVPRRDRLSSMMAEDDFGLGLGVGKMTLTTD